MSEIVRGPFVGEPGLERLVETLELAQSLRMVGAGVDQLDPKLSEGSLELHFDVVQATREGQRVVRQHLPRQTVATGRHLEAVPSRSAGR